MLAIAHNFYMALQRSASLPSLPRSASLPSLPRSASAQSLPGSASVGGEIRPRSIIPAQHPSIFPDQRIAGNQARVNADASTQNSLCRDNISSYCDRAVRGCIVGSAVGWIPEGIVGYVLGNRGSSLIGMGAGAVLCAAENVTHRVCRGDSWTVISMQPTNNATSTNRVGKGEGN